MIHHLKPEERRGAGGPAGRREVHELGLPHLQPNVGSLSVRSEDFVKLTVHLSAATSAN